MSDDLELAVGRHVPRETRAQLDRYMELLLSANEHQNLVARSTVSAVWTRHIVDCAQIVRHTSDEGTSVDIGSGAGLPGLVIAILRPNPITLVEPRRLRAEFLGRCAAELGLNHVSVEQANSRAVVGSFDLITARAVAPLSELLAQTMHLSHVGTRWVLPKGRKGAKELAEARLAWQGHFQLEPSITEGDAVIIIASQVSAKRKGRG